ncbi:MULTISPECIES: hypothetical protein [Rhizobium]|uniref:hypothetical protein n=1 Tax=Rhizobium TaxID=379 RepID=UPI00026ECDCA|nr:MULTISPECIES: hypothetical protein [Rhizobium]OCJ25568.1 hypothetical protein A6U88_03730 [Agrobacterium sp. B131/95]EJK87335.1 hypothetical protein PMI03_01346 [Rhizobium sp. AP16]MDJ1632171.1 hypothetical protein [Rhizobium rhizogenes]NTG73572.1 hypothetical protein [Rhizobium rhizogenes]NTH12119.1 hypothetical protein [Rhizobium rhizogenes]
MTKVRWFDLKTKMHMRTLAERLGERKYNRDIGDGFQIDKIRANSISGEYIQRVHYAEEVIDPAGQRETFERFEYRRMRFAVNDGMNRIEFWDSGRQQNRLITQLLEASNFDLTITPISLNPQAWAKAFQAAIDIKTKVDSIHTRNIRIGEGAVAHLQIEGTSDLTAALIEYSGRSDLVPDKVRLRMQDRLGTVTFASSAVIDVKARDTLPFIEVARKTLDIALKI